MTGLTAYLVQALVTLALLAVVAVALFFWARKWMTTAHGAGGQMHVVDQIILGVGVRLVIVQVDQKRLLLAVTQQQVTLLCELPPSEHPNA